MNQPSVGIIVLAAGASTRMGAPKQLLRYGGEPLLRRSMKTALNSLCRPVIAVLGAGAEALRPEIADLPIRFAINPDWEEGMASSIRCGLADLEMTGAGEIQAAILMLCDQPLVTTDMIARLADAFRQTLSPVVATRYTEDETAYGVPALFHRSLFAELLALKGAEGAKRVIARHRSRAVFLLSAEAALDIDTPEDYRALLKTP